MLARPNLNEVSATEAASAIEEGTATSESLVAACLERISDRDQDVRAWAFVDGDRALKTARAMDRSPRTSRLHGVPVGVKDVIDTADFPTAYNSPIYAGYQPKADAACVALLKRAGCVVLGKTMTAEFAQTHPPETKNPRNLSYTPGGSSSGSAAAVADFMTPLALGTQTAGSVIRPAAYCGIFSIKPSYGTINRSGMKFISEFLDTIGLLARSPNDLALLLEILSGLPIPKRAESQPRIGLCRTGSWSQADETAQSNLLNAARSLERAGAKISEFELPQEFDRLPEEHKIISGFECARALAWEHTNFPSNISPALSARLASGWKVTRAEYDAIREKACRSRRTLASMMQDFDFLLTLSAAGAAPSTLATTGDSLFNRMWTLLGNPCVAVPHGEDSNGMPLGLQLVGAMGTDMPLIGWAEWASQRLRV